MQYGAGEAFKCFVNVAKRIRSPGRRSSAEAAGVHTPGTTKRPPCRSDLSDGVSTPAQLKMGTSSWGPTGRWKLHAPLQKHDVEQLLWKAVYYRPIEEFR